jgi:AGZA family xanthine/uracil permease-like MFS transporter
MLIHRVVHDFVDQMVETFSGNAAYIHTRSLPDCLKKAIPAGIGLFIAFLGFQNVGIIQANQYTLVQFVDIHGALKAGAFFADVENAKAFMPAILAFLGLLVIAILEKHNVKGGVLISIAGISVLYYLLSGTTPTFDMSQIGQTFKDFGSIGITGVFQADAWKRAFTGSELGGIFSAIMLIVTFCLVDMFDTIGTLYGTASQANMLDKNGDPINVNQCMTSDSVATVAGAVCGTSTCTTFVESAAGVGAGGRTGLTSLVVAICFAICLFLSPVASLVPTCATAPALIYVGVLMLQGLKNVDFSDMDQMLPVSIMLIGMPISGSIGHAIGLGLISYTFVKVLSGKAKDVSVLTYVISALFLVKFFAVV